MSDLFINIPQVLSVDPNGPLSHPPLLEDWSFLRSKPSRKSLRTLRDEQWWDLSQIKGLIMNWSDQSNFHHYDNYSISLWGQKHFLDGHITDMKITDWNLRTCLDLRDPLWRMSVASWTLISLFKGHWHRCLFDQS